MERRLEAWDTRPLPSGQRVEFWHEALAASHLRFNVDVPDPALFQAVVSRRRFGEVALVECAVTPSGGRRGRRELSVDPGWAGVLVVRSGRERVCQAGHELVVGPGDVLVWDGELPVEFQVLEPLRKRSLLLPRGRVLGLGGCVPVHVPAGSPHGRLLGGYLEMLSRELPRLDEPACASAANAALELLRAVVAPTNADLRTTVLPRVRAFVDARLHDPDLDPPQVAAAHAISVRTLHTLFEPTGETLGGYVRRRRLEKAREDLRGRPGVPVSLVAARWGFRSTAHFSRSFREAYGSTPREVRDAAREFAS